MEDDLLGPQELAQMLGVKPNTVNIWRSRGKLLEPWRVVSGTPIWRVEDVQAWLGVDRA